MTDSFYDFFVKDIPDACTKVYVAKILGKHPEYKYRREFVPLKQYAASDGFDYIADVDDFGVYECSVKRYKDGPDGILVERDRTWFMMFDGVAYKLRAELVMDTWRWLENFLEDGEATPIE